MAGSGHRTQPGISVLLTLLRARRAGWARLMLCLLIIPILGWACWRWLERTRAAARHALAVAGVLLCPAVLFGSGQIYADLLSGAVIVALAVLALEPGEDRGEAATVAPAHPVEERRPLAGLSSASQRASSHGCTSRTSPLLACSACSPRGRSGANGPGATRSPAAPGGDTQPAPRSLCSAPPRSSCTRWRHTACCSPARRFTRDGNPVPPRRGGVDRPAPRSVAWPLLASAALLPRPDRAWLDDPEAASAHDSLAAALRIPDRAARGPTAGAVPRSVGSTGAASGSG